MSLGADGTALREAVDTYGDTAGVGTGTTSATAATGVCAMIGAGATRGL